MAKNLVIVESPAKVKTIKKFLGSNYEVTASMGHIRDLPKSTLGIDVDNNYEPKYITIRGKGDLLASLRKEVKKADVIYLATDPDREGEAISWHLYEGLKLAESNKKIYRITFNEITKNAVKESIKNPREIDMNLVNAQQARRMLDRLVGYKISPLLWSKVKRGLSAGRVQSAALRIICDREAEINAFIPNEYWTVDALFNIEGNAKKKFSAHFYSDKNGKKTVDSKAEAEKIEADLKTAVYKIKEIKRGERTKKAPLPFTTSTLQQEAGKVLNFTTQKTMSVAQQLYEGVDVKGQGTVGIITYLRTDSTRISDEAIAASKAYIEANYGPEYVSEYNPAKKDAKKVQDAHEAIRPTDISRTPDSIKASLSRDQYKLYSLIWKRFVACRMANALYETMSLKLEASGYTFTSSASKIKFDGFMSVYIESDAEAAENSFMVTEINEDTKLSFNGLESKQHFTQPPAHYTEASLVKALEEMGIGRPSTYAPTITTIVKRHYVLKEQKNLFISELGEIVNDIMVKQFPSIVDAKFTAYFETLLDKVDEGDIDWRTVVSNFYPDLSEAVVRAEAELEHVTIKDEVTDEICEKCGRNMVIKYNGKGEKFLACPGFPECTNTKTLLVKMGVPCPKCNKEVVLRRTKKGRTYYGCEGYPECDFISWNLPVKEKCPKCGSYMVKKGNKICCNDAQCGYVEPAKKDGLS